ncbi:hypothetical protein TNCV_2378551 [Trichonephila clavipes]|nr:hypothetical protein TNCV_2378551 [Trichonephila clavipes]
MVRDVAVRFCTANPTIGVFSRALIMGGVGTSESERCHLNEDKVQDALGRPVVEKTVPSSDDNRMWRPRGERLNPAFTLQRHTATTAGVMVWGVIAYNTGHS